MMELNGAIALVTGGARGIGRAIVEAYARQGIKTVIVDILEGMARETAASISAATGSSVLPITADVSQPSEVYAAVAKVERELGPIDILVNCAGILKTIAPTWEADPQVWLQEIMINLYGNFLCCQAVAQRMVVRRSGYILCLVGGGVSDSHAYSLGYACSKVSVTRLVEGLARELDAYGVKVYALQPGATRTAMTEYILNSPEGQKWRPGFDRLFQENQDAPPEEIAQLALNLLSGRVDGLSGRYINAQWDFDELVRSTNEIVTRDLLTLRIRETSLFPAYPSRQRQTKS